MESLIAYLLAVFLTVSSGYGTNNIYMANGAKATGIIFIGDSRTVGLASALNGYTGNNVFFVGKTGAGFSWFMSEGKRDVESLVKTHPDIINWVMVINMGVNDPLNRTKYSSEYLRLKKDEWSDYSIYVCAVSPVGTLSSISNDDVKKFNSGMRYALQDSEIEFLDDFSNVGFNTSDGLHFTEKTYRELYVAELKGIQKKISRQEETILINREETAQRGDHNGRNASMNIVGSGRGFDLAAYACQFVGNPYVYGGTSLTNGCDCSGFVQAVYAAFGYSLSRTSYDQAMEGIEVPLSEARAGDIFYYGGHVAIYLGDNNIVHASTPKGGIKVNSSSYRRVKSVRRIIQ